MDPRQELTAEEIVNHWPEKELADLLYQIGGEQDSRRIARKIVRARPIRIDRAPGNGCGRGTAARGRQKLHPATKTYLALRIAVNREPEELGQFLSRTPATLNSGARWIVLSYHSLEDRLVRARVSRAGARRRLPNPDQARGTARRTRSSGQSAVAKREDAGD